MRKLRDDALMLLAIFAVGSFILGFMLNLGGW